MLVDVSLWMAHHFIIIYITEPIRYCGQHMPILKRKANSINFRHKYCLQSGGKPFGILELTPDMQCS